MAIFCFLSLTQGNGSDPPADQRFVLIVKIPVKHSCYGIILSLTFKEQQLQSDAFAFLQYCQPAAAALFQSNKLIFRIRQRERPGGYALLINHPERIPAGGIAECQTKIRRNFTDQRGMDILIAHAAPTRR